MTTIDRAPAASVFAPVAAPTVLLGLIGAGIQLSRTPRMHEAEAAAQGMKLVYRLSAPKRFPIFSHRRRRRVLPGSISPIPASRR
jgi:hypothetical protein